MDDRSPDGTADRVRSQQCEDRQLHLLEGEKCGLGRAYSRGFLYALEQLSADLVCEMDADFSHCPEDLPRLFEAITEGADFVIGSRYVEGGETPPDWGWWRSTLSREGNRLARCVAGVETVRDCTAGFRVIRADVLRRLPFERLTVKGYAFQIALLVEAKKRGAVVREVPVSFIERTHGTSKLGWSDIVEFGWFSLELGLHRWRGEQPSASGFHRALNFARRFSRSNR